MLEYSCSVSWAIRQATGREVLDKLFVVPREGRRGAELRFTTVNHEDLEVCEIVLTREQVAHLQQNLTKWLNANADTDNAPFCGSL